MVTENKFKQFIPVLEVYIEENFSATLAYNKSLVFKDYLETARGHREHALPLPHTEVRRRVNSHQFLLKFVVSPGFFFLLSTVVRAHNPSIRCYERCSRLWSSAGGCAGLLPHPPGGGCP